MKKLILCLFILLATFICLPPFSSAQTTSQSAALEFSQPLVSYQKAKVIQIKREYTKTVNGVSNNFITIELDVIDGEYKDKTIILEHNASLNPALKNEIKEGSTVVLQAQKFPNAEQFVITDMYRLNTIIVIVFIFAVLTVFMTGKKGIGALVGLGISLAVILGFIVPQILNGRDVLEVSIIGSFIILLVTTYLAHGVTKTTSIAIVSTGISLIITYFLAQGVVLVTDLTGLGNEDVYMLEMMPGVSINPQGILLGGIIIGTLGALNDMTVTQVTTIFSLFKENQKQSLKHLYKEGSEIGKQHILSLVNTLVLAYAGSALPVFVFLILNPQNLPLWVIINSEPISEEIVRSIVGGLGLILAVPIATILAAYLAFNKVSLSDKKQIVGNK